MAAVALALGGSPLEDTVGQLRGPLGADLPLLLVTAVVDRAAIGLAHRHGAAGLVGWEAGTDGIVAAVRTVLLGDSVLPSEVPAASSAHPLQGLTDREREVVELLAKGSTNGEIAATLGISYHTVRTHVQHVMVKMDVRHRHAVAVIAQRDRVPRGRGASVGRALETAGGPAER